MRKMIALLAIMLAALGYSAFVFAMGGDIPAGQVNIQPDWPAELVELLTCQDTVNGIWVNANDFYYYAGDTDTFNEILKQYAKLGNTPLRLVLHPGRGMSGSLGDEADIPYEWQVGVMRWHDDPSEAPLLVTMQLWLGGQVQLGSVKVPLNIEVESGGEIEEFIEIHEGRRGKIGSEAHDFTLTSADGEMVSLSDFKGKSTVIMSIGNPYT
jgi:hypothetical protein